MSEGSDRVVSLRQFVSDSVLFGLGGMADRLIGFLFLPITSAILGSAGFGVYNLYVTTSAIVFLFTSIGMQNTYFRFGADDTGDWNAKQVLDTAFSIIHMLMALWLPLLVILATPFADLAIGAAEPAFTYLLCVRTYCDVVGSLADTRLQAEGRIRQYLYLRLPVTILTRTLTLGALIWFRTPLALAAGEALGAVCGAAIAYFWVLPDVRFRLHRPLWRSMFRYGAGLSPGMLADWLLVAVNRYLLKAFSPGGLNAVGIFSLAERFSSIMLLISQATILGWRRFAFHNMHREQGPGLLARAFTLLFIVCMLSFTALSLLGPDAVRLLLTEEFLPSIPVIPILTLGAVFGAMAASVRIGLLKQFKTNTLSLILGLAAAVSIAVATFTIPRYGALGAAVAALAGQSLVFVLNWRWSQKSYFVPFEYGRIATVAALTAAALAAGWAAMTLDAAATLAIHVALLAALPPAIYRLGPWSEQERATVAQGVEQVVSRFLRRPRP